MNSKTFETLDRPAHPVWDQAFTRLWQRVSGRVEGCVQRVGERLDGLGLHCATRTHVGPRGVTTVLRVNRTPMQALFDLSYTLVDGLPEAHYPGARLELRLRDAEGHVLADGRALTGGNGRHYFTAAEPLLDDAANLLSPAAVLALVREHFDLLHHQRQRAR